MSQTCQRCYRIVHRACQDDTEAQSCSNLRRPKDLLPRRRVVTETSIPAGDFLAEEISNRRRS